MVLHSLTAPKLLFADKGYISQSLFETLFSEGVNLVTGIKSNMKNRLMSFWNRIAVQF